MTAVEWLQSQIVFESVDKELLARWDEDTDLSEYFEQAKEMEKEQMIEFACQVAESSAMKYIQGKTTRMIAEELLTFKSE